MSTPCLLSRIYVQNVAEKVVIPVGIPCFSFDKLDSHPRYNPDSRLVSIPSQIALNISDTTSCFTVMAALEW